MTKCGR